MARACRGVKVWQVARLAGRDRALVEAIEVALGAGDREMDAGEWELRGAVLEGRGCPGRRGVALGAGGHERRQGVLGVGGAAVVRLVATDTRRGFAPVDPVGMAVRTGHGPVGTGERIAHLCKAFSQFFKTLICISKLVDR